MTDVSGEQVDLAHMCVTTLGYLNGLLIPDAWTGWAGDLASAMGNVKTVMEWNPVLTLPPSVRHWLDKGMTIVPTPASGTLFLEKNKAASGRPLVTLATEMIYAATETLSTSRTSSSKVGVVTPIYYLV